MKSFGGGLGVYVLGGGFLDRSRVGLRLFALLCLDWVAGVFEHKLCVLTVPRADRLGVP